MTYKKFSYAGKELYESWDGNWIASTDWGFILIERAGVLNIRHASAYVQAYVSINYQGGKRLVSLITEIQRTGDWIQKCQEVLNILETLDCSHLIMLEDDNKGAHFTGLDAIESIKTWLREP